MKIFEIFDSENDLHIGVLLYYDHAGAYIIELSEELNEWTAPLLFTHYIDNGIFTVPSAASLMWVRERVIPSSRQNIGNILARYNMNEYDEMKLLELSHGKCSQDSLFIKKLDELPEYVKKRQLKNVRECIVSPRGYLICFFEDGSIKKVILTALKDAPDVEKIIKHGELMLSGKPGPGGYSVTFNDDIEIPSVLLYENGETVPLEQDDFLSFVRRNVLDTPQCCELLNCSRQNLSYMAGKGYLKPVRENVKGSLYLTGDVLKSAR